MKFVALTALFYLVLVSLANGQCGKRGERCCKNLNNTDINCYSGMYCDSNSGNTCQINCGKIGQFCCSNSPSGGCTSEPNLFCQSDDAELGAGYNICTPNCGLPAYTGNSAQPCCRNNYCKSPGSTIPVVSCDATQVCVEGTVAPFSPCGSFNQTCCTGDKCAAGLFCDRNSFSGQALCRHHCGGNGQRCCPTVSSGYNGCDFGLYCEGSTRLCTENCAFEGQKCCPQGYCSSGTFCNSAAYCDKTRTNCGAPGQTCCSTSGLTGIAADSKCALGRRCNAATNTCTVGCGLRGQQCCALSTGSLWCEGTGSCRTVSANDTTGLCV